MLPHVRQLPITIWNSTSDEATICHIGPLAQDYTATFGIVTDDRQVCLIDAGKSRERQGGR